MRDLKEAFKQLEESMRALDERIAKNPELSAWERDAFYQPMVDLALQLDRLGHEPTPAEPPIEGTPVEEPMSRKPDVP